MAIIEEINELIANKEFSEAKKKIEEAINEYSEDVEFLKLAGLTYVNLELWKNAKQNFESAIKYSNEDATSWFYLAKCYEKLGDFVASKNAYITVIKLRPEYLDAYKNLCVVLMKMNDTNTAIEYAQAAKEVDDDFIFDFIILFISAMLELVIFEISKRSSHIFIIAEFI